MVVGVRAGVEEDNPREIKMTLFYGLQNLNLKIKN